MISETILNPGARLAPFVHDVPFDPTYGYNLDSLLTLTPPQRPDGFADFWKGRYRQALQIDVRPVRVRETAGTQTCRVWEIQYRSTGGTVIGGWLMTPRNGPVRRGFIVGHGYGGREAPDLDFPLSGDSAVLFPCARGISKSPSPTIPPNAEDHVLCGIDRVETYVLGGCVDDVWCGVTALRQFVPATGDRLYYAGQSFGGGIGALALPWDPRILAAHLVVPTFGNHPVRLSAPCWGSGESVRQYAREHPEIVDRVLPAFDAAIAAASINIPVLTACALFDPTVPPPGQFSVYNQISGPKWLYVLQAGHYDYPTINADLAALRKHVIRFFHDVESSGGV